MKKKIRDLTPVEIFSYCQRRNRHCEECPLNLTMQYCLNNFKTEENRKILNDEILDREVEL